jgi:hypothetical protein
MFDRRFAEQRLAGAAIKRMMRRRRVTIKALAFQMQITQKRVREARDEGVNGTLIVQDWLEGISKAMQWKGEYYAADR